VACASAYGADRLIFLTDVPGVKGTDGEIIRTLTPDGCEKLISNGVATGGMQAKLNAATDALQNGIGQVIIAPGAMEGAAERILSGESIGTRLVTEGVVHA
jgi:acetylglutamate kinase